MLLQAGIAAAAVGAYSFFVEPRWYRVREKTVRIKTPFHRPLELLHLSDFHFYDNFTSAIPFIHSLGKREVDLILITGDMIDDDTGIDHCISAVQGLKSRYGIYAVLGNHDYYCVGFENLLHMTGTKVDYSSRQKNDIDTLIRRLADHGIQVLRNERKTISIDGEELTLIGIDDPYVFKDDLNRTFQGFERNGPSLVMVHSPERHLEILKHNVDMVFSGHTHGGQVQVPFLGPIVTRTTAPRRFADGIVQENGTVFHTTRGVGTGRLTPPRLNCRPEAVFFRLECGPAS